MMFTQVRDGEGNVGRLLQPHFNQEMNEQENGAWAARNGGRTDPRMLSSAAITVYVPSHLTLAQVKN